MKKCRKGLECMFWRDSKKIQSTTSCAKSPLVWVFLAFAEKRGSETEKRKNEQKNVESNVVACLLTTMSALSPMLYGDVPRTAHTYVKHFEASTEANVSVENV